MKIGLTGDTHGSMQNLRRVIAAAPPVEQWLHTGDYARDSLYLKSQTGLEVTAVCGNCDAGETDFNVDEFLYLQGFNIWLAHGHRYLHGGSRRNWCGGRTAWRRTLLFLAIRMCRL